MFELASALFSIADANEFRFARFYIVCEEALLALLKSPPIVCGCRTSFADCQNVERHGIGYKSGREEILAFCSNEYPMHCFYLELYCILHFIVTGNLFSALCASLILRLF